MNIASYKRIKAEIPNIDTKSYGGFTYQSSREDFVPSKVDVFFNNASEDEIEKVLYAGRSDREKNTGLGVKIKEDLIAKRNSGFYLKIDKSFSDDDFIIINYSLDEKNDVLFDFNVIDVAENVKATIVVNYEGGSNNAFRNGFYHINLAKFSELNLVKIQDFSEGVINLESTKIEIKERAKLDCYPIEFGSSVCLTSSSTYQKEDWSEVSIHPLFFVDDDRKADYEQSLIVNGENSLGIIDAKGCVKDNATKVFRGNVFLNRGCRRSIGRFSDKSVIMNDGIKAHTIPTIFCDEDDVMGEHAGSFEPLKLTELYYLMSRGFDKKTARKILVKSSFLPAINLINNRELREKLIDKLDYRLDK